MDLPDQEGSAYSEGEKAPRLRGAGRGWGEEAGKICVWAGWRARDVKAGAGNVPLRPRGALVQKGQLRCRRKGQRAEVERQAGAELLGTLNGPLQRNVSSAPPPVF